jgi:MFS family permease
MGLELHYGVIMTSQRHLSSVIPPLLRNVDFRRFWTGQTISVFGDQVSFLALPLAAVLVLDASAAEMGLLGAANLIPHLLLSLPVGVWVDRLPHRRRVMIAADIGRALLLGSVPLAYALGVLTIGQLYLVAFLTGCLTVFFDISYSTVFVSVTPGRRYVEANSLLHGSRSLSNVGGPALAGGLVQLLSAPAALLADAISFLGSAFFLGRVRAREPELEPEADGRIRARIASGFRFIFASPILRASLAGVATINFFNYMFWALFVLFATRTLDVKPGQLGTVLAAAGIGGVIGALIAGRLGRRIGVGPAYVLGCALFPAPLLLVPLAGGPHFLVVAMLFTAEFASSIGVMILDINGNSISTAITPDRVRGRVAGANRFVNYGVRPLGSLAGGFLGAAIGLRPTLWIAAAGALTGLLWLLPSPVVRLRELPSAAD